MGQQQYQTINITNVINATKKVAPLVILAALYKIAMSGLNESSHDFAQLKIKTTVKAIYSLKLMIIFVSIVSFILILVFIK